MGYIIVANHCARDSKFSYLQISTVLGDLWAYTSDFKIISTLRGNHALESNVFAHKFLRLSLYKKIQRDNLFHAYSNRPIEIIQCAKFGTLSKWEILS